MRLILYDTRAGGSDNWHDLDARQIDPVLIIMRRLREILFSSRNILLTLGGSCSMIKISTTHLLFSEEGKYVER
jgi:hypothetical protein